MKHLLLCLTMLMCASAYSRVYVGYSYDASGNRIRRIVIVDYVSQQTLPDFEEDSVANMSDISASVDIQVAPNPTSGLLHVNIPGLADGDKGTACLYSQNGVPLISAGIEGATTTMDISSLPDGMYFLVISLDGGRRTWKIVKK